MNGRSRLAYAHPFFRVIGSKFQGTGQMTHQPSPAWLLLLSLALASKSQDPVEPKPDKGTRLALAVTCYPVSFPHPFFMCCSFSLPSLLLRVGFQEFPLNPKAVSLGELYGEYNLSTNEWTDGILSSVMRLACAGT